MREEKQILAILNEIQADIKTIKQDIKGIYSNQKKSKYTLSALLNQCDLDAPIPKSVKDWDTFFDGKTIESEQST